MNTGTIIAVVVVIVVVAAVVIAVLPMVRRRRLQQRFGPEYDRAVESHENRAAAERELMEREKRHRQLELRPLAPEVRDRYAAQWTEVQARFVDEPQNAVVEADRLVTALMAERGYPTEGYEQQAADLSVEHATTLGHYHAAHDIRQRMGASAGAVETEDLRNAMVHYRELFVDLLDSGTASDEDRRAAAVGDHHAGDHHADDRLADDRYADGQYTEGRHADDRLADDRVADSRLADDRYADDQYADSRRPDARYADDRLADDRLADGRHSADDMTDRTADGTTDRTAEHRAAADPTGRDRTEQRGTAR